MVNYFIDPCGAIQYSYVHQFFAFSSRSNVSLCKLSEINLFKKKTRFMKA